MLSHDAYDSPVTKRSTPRDRLAGGSATGSRPGIGTTPPPSGDTRRGYTWLSYGRVTRARICWQVPVDQRMPRRPGGQMTNMARRNLLLAGGGAAAAAALGVRPTAATAHSGGDPGGHSVVAWNRTLLPVLRTPGTHPAPGPPPRTFAVMHAAVPDAGGAAPGNGRPDPFPGGARDPPPRAAAARAR